MRINLKTGVVPISFAAAHLAKLLKQATDGPIVITQKGRPSGVLLSVEEYDRMNAPRVTDASELIITDEALQAALRGFEGQCNG